MNNIFHPKYIQCLPEEDLDKLDDTVWIQLLTTTCSSKNRKIILKYKSYFSKDLKLFFELPEEIFIDYFYDKNISWKDIIIEFSHMSRYDNLDLNKYDISPEFWKNISLQSSLLSDKFIITHKCKITWEELVKNRRCTEALLRQCTDCFNDHVWRDLVYNQKLSEDFIIDYYRFMNPVALGSHQTITQKIVDAIPAIGFLNNPTSWNNSKNLYW